MALTVVDHARGKWVSILSQFGISVKRNVHGPCPICGGRDRFRFDDQDGRGTYYCSRCGAGSGFHLIKNKTNWPMSRVFAEVEKMANDAPIEKIQEKYEDAEKRRKALNDMWTAGKPISVGDTAGEYLHRRTGLKVFPSVLRLHPALYHAETKSNHPALIAKVTDIDNKPVAIHRTWLVDVQPKKKLTAGSLPSGSAIRLEPYEESIGIAEGIETAISAWAAFNIPTWAAISANGLEKWEPPKAVKKVFIFGDNDHSFTGQLAAYRLAHRLRQNEKLEIVKVVIPNIVGADWCDVLMLLGTEKARGLVQEMKWV
jgi:putative DNA primase/helicase